MRPPDPAPAVAIPTLGDFQITGFNPIVGGDSTIGQIDMSAIVTRHGARLPAADADKHFTAAFVVVSATPAQETVLAQVVEWQEIFGKHQPARGGWRSFEDHASGRATMETRIGRRRVARPA